jgi:phytoene dehydrogenase-like protein
MRSQPSESSPDAVVVGAGPNGLAAAVALAQAGKSVLVLEAGDEVGGGARTKELTLPGYLHDVCSAIHPLTLASPFLRSLPLFEHGLELLQPEAPYAHPLDDGSAAVAHRSIDATADTLAPDGRSYAKLMRPLVEAGTDLTDALLAPPHVPRHPVALARFGRSGIRSAAGLVTSRFTGASARALLSGVAAHSMLPLGHLVTGGYALMLALLAHSVGWPAAKGGSGAITKALAAYLESLGGRVVTDFRVEAFSRLPPGRAYLFDVTPRQLVDIAGDELPAGYRRRLDRYRYGAGVFKVDWALDAPIPWKADECARAGTVHVGGTFEEIASAELDVWNDRHPDRPYVLLAQQSLFDPTRAPPGRHTAWAYCHVPSGSTVDMTERMEAQIERFAPGFRDLVLARNALGPADLHRYNANYIGGDINGGIQDLRQHFMRPAPRLVPYATPNERIFICSSSTPPGGGVHGMCGYHAAQAVLRRAL